ncbi:hypothetical protein DPU22_21700 [Salmonella enterica subsp. enterica serovar Newport]|uniref:Uncharacterized protein n=1 Tax=Salmonella enterica I TaxID=59201 RepID=A0A3V2NZG9_SALET|nr:hypothetical protein [Salmonella enterica subsp. enterica serovar Newport]EBR9096763.1 hypothetical protein [Salmonella enterica subsp. enterica serovar Newport]EBS3605373.1 hypothetical protein [Salmonella enterica subsp. enterica serovar Newport]EBU7019815.1 hypothetical protein [Salmonella enterica subsp. enterica serovar Newport]EBU7071233.1 hypothetical protein [Salmonella enterica subsp. enterica serovar Newport]
MYHGQGISEAVFSALRAGSQGRVITQHLVATAADDDATSCVSVPQRAGEDEADPGLRVFGSAEKFERAGAALAIQSSLQ